MKNYAIIHSYSMMMSMQIIPEINPKETPKKTKPNKYFYWRLIIFTYKINKYFLFLYT